MASLKVRHALGHDPVRPHDKRQFWVSSYIPLADMVIYQPLSHSRQSLRELGSARLAWGNLTTNHLKTS